MQNKTYVIHGKELAGTGLLYVRHVHADASVNLQTPMLNICVAKSAMLNAGFTESAVELPPLNKLRGFKNAWTWGLASKDMQLTIFDARQHTEYALDVFVRASENDVTKMQRLTISMQQFSDNSVNRLTWVLDISSVSDNKATPRYVNERPDKVLPSYILDQLTSR